MVFAVASSPTGSTATWPASRGLVTDFGKIADPIADKALTGTALVGLSMLGELPWWVTVVILVRELGITLLRFWVIRHGVIAGQPRRQVQDAAAGGGDRPLPAAADRLAARVAAVVMAAALVLTVVTGVDYVARGARGCAGRADAGVSAPGRRHGLSARPPDDHAAAACWHRGLARAPRRATVALAESLTGGLLDRGADRAGRASSDAVRGGVVVYATDSRPRWPAYRCRCWTPRARSARTSPAALAARRPRTASAPRTGWV